MWRALPLVVSLLVLASPAAGQGEVASCPARVAFDPAPYLCAGGDRDGSPCSGPGDLFCLPGGGECLPAEGGRATWYDYPGFGACLFDVDSPATALVAAVNEVDYGSGDFCGRCARVTGPEGSVVVRVVDKCAFDPFSSPWCDASGHIDLNRPAFDAVADPAEGVVPVSWETVPCDTPGPVHFFYKAESNPFWVAVQVREHRYGIGSVEMLSEGQWVALPRQPYNFFISESFTEQIGPFTFRLTDLHGQVIGQADIPFAAGVEFPGTSQFPVCEGLLFADGFESGDTAAWSNTEPPPP